MGIDNIDILKKDPDPIRDMKNFIRSRQKRGKTQRQIAEDLFNRGYDLHSILALIMRYWEPPDGL